MSTGLGGKSLPGWTALLLSLVLAPAAAGASRPGTVAKDRVAGGEHWRLNLSQGRIHVWRPAGFDPSTAGIVVYIHGYTVDADAAWEQHGLAKQFEASRRNAIFVVPEAPASADERVYWPSLTELLRAVGSTLGMPRPAGPLVVVGHSAAHQTVVPWLKNHPISHVILLDAIYSEDTVRALQEWLGNGRGRLTVVVADTTEDSERLFQRVPDAVRRPAVPESCADFTTSERRARAAYFRSQYGHLEMVSAGKVIAPLLGLTNLPPVGASSRVSATHDSRRDALASRSKGGGHRPSRRTIATGLP